MISGCLGLLWCIVSGDWCFGLFVVLSVGFSLLFGGVAVCYFRFVWVTAGWDVDFLGTCGYDL